MPESRAVLSDFGAIGQSMQEFAASAMSGGFAVNDVGGQALLNAIQAMQDWVDRNLYAIEQFRSEPALGASHGAQAMKPHVAAVASDNQGFLPMLLKFRESLDAAERGIIEAMKNYGKLDTDGAQTFQA